MTDDIGGVRSSAELHPQSDPPRELSAGHTPTPWEVLEIETQGGGGERYVSYGVADQNGKIVMDAMNSSVAELHWEDDGEPAGHVFHWDDQGKRDAAFIVKAVNAHDELVKALLHAAARFESIRNWAKGDGTKFPGLEADSAEDARIIRAALAMLSEGLPTVQPESTSHAPKSSP